MGICWTVLMEGSEQSFFPLRSFIFGDRFKRMFLKRLQNSIIHTGARMSVSFLGFGPTVALNLFSSTDTCLKLYAV